MSLLLQGISIAQITTEILEQLAVTEEDTAVPTLTPNPHNRYLPFPLNEIQQAYWMGRTNMFELGNVSTHVYLEFASDLSIEELERAWNRVILQHEMLRCVILPNGEQKILAEVSPYQIETIDLRGLTSEEIETQIEAIRSRLAHQVRPLERYPLFDICALQLSEQNYRLCFSIENIIADAASLGTIARDWCRLYQNPHLDIKPLELSFRDYVLSLNSLEKSSRYQRAWEYWQQRLIDLPQAPELPLAKSITSIQKPHFVRRTHTLAPELWQPLKQKFLDAGLTFSGGLLTAFAEIIALWSKNPRFTITLTTFNRFPLHSQVNELVGDFTSLNLLAIDYSQTDSFNNRAKQVQMQLWSDLNYSDVSGIRLLRELAKQNDNNVGAAFPVIFTSLLSNPQIKDSDRGSPLAWLGEIAWGISQTPQVYLDHQVYEEAGALVFNWDAVEELFPVGLLDDMFATYCSLLEKLATEPESWQSQQSSQLIPTSQLQKFKAINCTDLPLTEDLLHSLFIRQLAQKPQQLAIITDDRSLTYQELGDRAYALSKRLQDLGAMPNQLIAVMMEKGWEQVVATLGILLAGAAYVPIDPELPSDRKKYLLEQGQVKLILTQSWLQYALQLEDNLTLITVDSESWQDSSISSQALTATPRQKPEDLAYVIYTSGSTGTPKGVAIDHRGAVNTILDINRRFDVNQSDRVLALSSLSFDLSVYDIFGTLAAGGSIVIPQAEQAKDPAHWTELVQEHQVTVWNSVPALMQLECDYFASGASSSVSSLRLVLLSGDWIAPTLPVQIKAIAPQSEIISLGGATEASIWSIYYPIDTRNTEVKTIPYGYPLSNQRWYVLDENFQPRPVWVPGQLYIGGIGLAKYYWSDPEKTNASFIIHPDTGERIYRTGDLGRYLPNGAIEFLGREDAQVKVQGYRIELGEIETVLGQYQGINQVVVNTIGEDNKRLIAYLVAQTEIAPENIRNWLSEKLPQYMIPSYFVFLDRLPLNSNGKINRKLLPEPKLETRPTPKLPESISPITTEVTSLVSQVLKVENLDIYVNMLELGANSVDIVRIANAIENKFQIRLKLSELAQASNLAALATAIEQKLPQLNDVEWEEGCL